MELENMHAILIIHCKFYVLLEDYTIESFGARLCPTFSPNN